MVVDPAAHLSVACNSAGRVASTGRDELSAFTHADGGLTSIASTWDAGTAAEKR